MGLEVGLEVEEGRLCGRVEDRVVVAFACNTTRDCNSPSPKTPRIRLTVVGRGFPVVD